MVDIGNKVAMRLAMAASKKTEAQEKEPAGQIVAAGLPALRRIRDQLSNKPRTRFNFTSPTTTSAREMMVEGEVKPCPRGCGPMVEVGLHGERRGITCTACRVTEPLNELHIEEN